MGFAPHMEHGMTALLREKITINGIKCTGIVDQIEDVKNEKINHPKWLVVIEASSIRIARQRYDEHILQ